MRSFLKQNNEAPTPEHTQTFLAAQNIGNRILESSEAKVSKLFPFLKREFDPSSRYSQVYERMMRAASVYLDTDPSLYSLSYLVDTIESNRKLMLFSYLEEVIKEKPWLCNDFLIDPSKDELSLENLNINYALKHFFISDYSPEKKYERIFALLNSPNATYENRGQAVFNAEYHGHSDIVRYLLNSGPISESDRGEVIYRASKNGHRETAKLLRPSICKSKLFLATAALTAAVSTIAAWIYANQDS